jgi:Cu(I)/Ag(I) efflux system membrane fusion protein
MKLVAKELEVRGDAVLAVPKPAVLDTGRRKLVYVETEAGSYIAREVTLGPEAVVVVNGVEEIFYPVISGLSEGERVVARGNFLIDSQAQLTGAAEAVYGGAIGKDEEVQTPEHQH